VGKFIKTSQKYEMPDFVFDTNLQGPANEIRESSKLLIISSVVIRLIPPTMYQHYMIPAKWSAWMILLALALAGCKQTIKDKNDTEHEPDSGSYMVVGYVAGYRGLDFNSIQAGKLTHINYAFANVIDGKVAFGTAETTIDDTELNAGDLIELQELKKINPRLKILVSVGGWTWSGNFSDVALTESSRKIFAASAVDFLKKYKLDGIDIDWEYPGQVGAGNTFREEDNENFTLLLKEVRSRLDDQSRQDQRDNDRKYLLTIATGADPAYFEHTNLGEAQQYLDFINIMAYDFHNGLHQKTGHHANLRKSDAQGATDLHVMGAIERHLEAGVPVTKINLGIPFYGRIWTGVPDLNHGLYQEAESTGNIIFYRTLVDSYINLNGFARYYDSTAQAPYLWNPDAAVFISYEDRESILKKIQVLKNMGLGGVMFWEYSDDYQGRLLDAIFEGLNPELNDPE